jgi:hypothetical protein
MIHVSHSLMHDGVVNRCERYCGSMGGQTDGGPGMQRYTALGEGSTREAGGMHSHLDCVGRQHGLWWRTSTLPPMGRRNFIKWIAWTDLSEKRDEKRLRWRRY